MRRRWLVVAIAAIAALAACNRLFGISEIPLVSDAHVFDDAPPDAAPMAILVIGDPELDFGQVTRGESSFAATVGVTNVGNAVTGMLGIMTTGAQGDYSINLGTCNTTLAPGAGCKLQITFMPVDAGTFNETVVIGDGVATTSMMLTGIGLAPGALSMPSPIGFGSAVIDSTTATQSITATNTGSVSVVIESFSVSGAGGSSFVVLDTGTCKTGTPVGGGSACSIDVEFEPKLGGTQLGSLTVMTGSDGNPSLSSLGGTGTTTVSVATSGTGSVESSDNAINCGTVCSAVFDTSTVTLTGAVSPETAISWTPNCVVQSSTSCAITVNQPSFDVTATFVPFPVLTVALSGTPGEVTGGGIDCESSSGGPTCSMAYQPNSTVLLSATGEMGSVFDDWSGACMISSSSSCMLTMTGNLSTTADFETGAGHVLNVKPEAGNSPDAGDTLMVGSTPCDVTNGCTIPYNGGAPGSVSIIATTDACSMFEGFMGPCEADDPPDQCTVDPASMQVTVVQFEFAPKKGPICVIGN
jgi:hypothetical protein